MNPRQIFQVIIKTFGLYFFVQAILSVKDIFMYASSLTFFGTDNDSETYFYIAQMMVDAILYFGFAWIMVAESEYVTDKLRIKNDDQIQFQLSKSDFMELVVISIGLMALLNAIPEILGKVTQFLYFNNYDPQDNYLFWNEKNRKAEIFFALFEAVVGILAMSNSRLIARRLSEIGDNNQSPPSSPEKGESS